MYLKPDTNQIDLMDKMFALEYEFRKYNPNYSFMNQRLGIDYPTYIYIYDEICKVGVTEGFIKMDAAIPKLIYEINQFKGKEFINNGGFESYFKALNNDKKWYNWDLESKQKLYIGTILILITSIIGLVIKKLPFSDNVKRGEGRDTVYIHDTVLLKQPVLINKADTL